MRELEKNNTVKILMVATKKWNYFSSLCLKYHFLWVLNFFSLFLLDEIATYSRSNVWVKQELHERSKTHTSRSMLLQDLP